jgi:hypothetical protein
VPLVALVLGAALVAACAGSGPDAEDAGPAPSAAPSPAPVSPAPVSPTPVSPTTATVPAVPVTTPVTTEAPTTIAPVTGSPTTEADTTGAEDTAETAVVEDPPAAASEGRSGGFTFEASAITPEVAARMVSVSWRQGCPVPLEALRYLRIGYWGFDGAVHVGELVVNADAVDAMAGAFGRLFDAGFPIRRMQLVDDYGGDDNTSIEADNTSAFNCRAATGSSNWSQHSYGLAIDVNPIENPYVYGDGTTSHAASEPYLDRSVGLPGMAVEGGVLVSAFDAVGWGWGGRWASPVDYQHFSASGG